eukprot:2611203-Alexandrium_andersonii.AAC.1
MIPAAQPLRHRREDLYHAARVVRLVEGGEERLEGVGVGAEGVTGAAEVAVGKVVPEPPRPRGGGLEPFERGDEYFMARWRPILHLPTPAAARRLLLPPALERRRAGRGTRHPLGRCGRPPIRSGGDGLNL